MTTFTVTNGYTADISVTATDYEAFSNWLRQPMVYNIRFVSHDKYSIAAGRNQASHTTVFTIKHMCWGGNIEPVTTPTDQLQIVKHDGSTAAIRVTSEVTNGVDDECKRHMETELQVKSDGQWKTVWDRNN